MAKKRIIKGAVRWIRTKSGKRIPIRVMSGPPKNRRKLISKGRRHVDFFRYSPLKKTAKRQGRRKTDRTLVGRDTKTALKKNPSRVQHILRKKRERLGIKIKSFLQKPQRRGSSISLTRKKVAVKRGGAIAVVPIKRQNWGFWKEQRDQLRFHRSLLRTSETLPDAERRGLFRVLKSDKKFGKGMGQSIARAIAKVTKGKKKTPLKKGRRLKRIK